MKLPGNEDAQNEEVMDLIHETHEDDKILSIEADGSISKRQTVYATKLYDHHREDRGVYLIYVPENMRRKQYGTKQALHNFMLDCYEAEVIDITEIDDDKMKSHIKEQTLKKNPFEEVHVFVKHTDDGRYKDEYRYERGPSEKNIRENEDLPEPGTEDEKYVYFHLGTVEEVVSNAEELGEQYEFDFKKTGGRWTPTDLLVLEEDNEIKEAMKTIENTEVTQ